MTTTGVRMDGWSRRDTLTLASILFVAALVRGVYLYLFSQSIWFDELIIDSLYHSRWADSIAQGNILGDGPYFRAPLYVYLLAFMRTIWEGTIWAPRVCGALMGVASVGVTFYLARRFSPRSLAYTAAIVAASAQALYPMLIFHEAEIMGDFLFAFLLQISLLRLLTIQEKHSWGAYAALGALLGLAALCRPTILPLTPLVALYIWRRATATRENIFRIGVVACVAVCVIAPVTIRNALIGRDNTLIATSGGINFYIGNNPSASLVEASLPEPLGSTWTLADMRGLAEIESGRALRPSEVSSYWSKRGWRWIAENPGDFLSHTAHKVYVFFADTPYSNNLPLDVMVAQNAILRHLPISFAFLLGFVVIGALAGRIERTHDMLWLAAFGLAHGLVIALFFVNERFRIPSIVVFFPLAGMGAAFLLAALSERRNVRAILSVAIGVAAYVYAIVPAGRPRENGSARENYLRGNTYLAHNNYAKAISAYCDALRQAPRLERAALNAGAAYFRLGESDSAESYFRAELLAHPGVADALGNLASLNLTRGAPEAAARFSTDAFRFAPYDITVVRIHLRALSAVGDTGAIRQVENVTEQQFVSDPRYWYERGVISMGRGKNDKAVKEFGRGAASPLREEGIEMSDEGFSRVHGGIGERKRAIALCNYQAGFIYGVGGKYDTAAQFSSYAIHADSSLAEAYINLINAHIARSFIDSARAVYRSALPRFRETEKARYFVPYAALGEDSVITGKSKLR